MTICKKANFGHSVQNALDSVRNFSWSGLDPATQSTLRTGGYGALAGGLGLGLTSLLDQDPDAKDERGTRLLKNMALGGVLGGVGGLGLQTGLNYYNTNLKTPSKEVMSPLQKDYAGLRMGTLLGGMSPGYTTTGAVLGTTAAPTVAISKSLKDGVSPSKGDKITELLKDLNSDTYTKIDPNTGKSVLLSEESAPAFRSGFSSDPALVSLAKSKQIAELRDALASKVITDKDALGNTFKRTLTPEELLSRIGSNQRARSVGRLNPTHAGGYIKNVARTSGRHAAVGGLLGWLADLAAPSVDKSVMSPGPLDADKVNQSAANWQRLLHQHQAPPTI